MPYKNKCASNKNGTEEKSSFIEHMINSQKNSPQIYRKQVTTEFSKRQI